MLYAPSWLACRSSLPGGIMVLFLFVIMLVNVERSSKERQFNRIWPVGWRRVRADGIVVVRVGEGQGAVSGATGEAVRRDEPQDIAKAL